MASDTLSRILDCGIVAVVRSEKPDQLIQVVEALASGGVTAAEITFTVPEADRVIREVRKALGDRIILGAGTVLDSETARTAILAGAEYLVTPCVNLDVIRLAKRYGKVVMPGGFTPTECLTAWEAGADIVKVFPADVVGPAFFKAMKGPLPQIRLMPTGGV
ncbi:MAG: bifunctional 4-hydroxy-2-oxoglutarate aldolase/2-dehydro-3-deoxy-phosphogluconate aldolase, partial [bacterium]